MARKTPVVGDRDERGAKCELCVLFCGRWGETCYQIKGQRLLVLVALLALLMLQLWVAERL